MRRAAWSRCIWAAGLCVTCMLALAPSSATAQERRPTPSAEHLWQDYPLEATPEASAAPSAAAPDTPARSTQSESESPGGDGPPILLLVAAGIAAAGAAALALRRLRARSPAAPRGAGALLPGLAVRSPLVSIPTPQGAMRTERSPRLALAASGDRPGSRRSSYRPPRPPGVAPPDPNLEWNAEIEWHHAAGGSRFRLVAGSPSAEGKTSLAESEQLEWPPSGPDSVVAMRRAVERLQSAAVEAGWQPAPAGRAWYSRRFHWEGAVPAPAPTPAAEPRPGRTGRFSRSAEWPADTVDLPRCEITWDVGYLKSHFRAMVFEPGGKLGKPACSSKPFRGYLAGTREADAEQLRAEVKALVDTMTEAGWEPAGRGGRWFSFRFVWRRDEAPNLHPVRSAGAAD